VLESLEAFFTRFQVLKATQGQALEAIESLLQRFGAALPGLEEKRRSWESENAPRFNIFRILRIQRREVKLHSRFLAELLDPLGSHSQRDKLLSLFWEIAGDSGLRRPTEWPEPSDWAVTTEEVVTEGRLDIVVRCRGFVTVIENKVDAGEQDEQLGRYADWLEKQKAEYPEQNLIFLTPDGRPPDTISTDMCVCLSYCEHIETWLKRAVTKIEAPWLRFAIEQYLQIVQSF